MTGKEFNGETLTAEDPEKKVKPGYKTTEFWITIATIVIGAVDSVGPIIAGLVGAGYAISRGIAKK